MQNVKFGARMYRSRTAPLGRAAEQPTGPGHASEFLAVSAGTTRDSGPVMLPTARMGAYGPAREAASAPGAGQPAVVGPSVGACTTASLSDRLPNGCVCLLGTLRTPTGARI